MVLLVSHVGFPNLANEKNKMQINGNYLTYAFAASIQTLPKRYTVPVGERIINRTFKTYSEASDVLNNSTVQQP